MDPDGTPVAASVPLSLSAAAAEADRYLALAGQRSQAGDFGPALFPPAVPASDVASLIADRNHRHDLFSRARGRHRIEVEALERDVTTPSQDELSRQNPARGGQVHPEVLRLMDNHPGMFGQQFGAEHPVPASKTIRPKSPGQRALECRRSRRGHT